MKKYLKNIIGAFVLVLMTASCGEDFLNVFPNDQLVAETAIASVGGAEAALYGVYNVLQATSSYNCNMITFGEVRGEDMQTVSRSDRTVAFYTFNNRTPDNVDANLWYQPYVAMNRINVIIKAFEDEKVTDGTEKQRDAILGQCYALRGLFHFDLVKLFGVPYLKDKTAPGAVIANRIIAANEKPQRNTVEETYTQAVNDLKEALTYLATTKEITDGYMNYWAAEALLARVYLYMGNYGEAYTHATNVITSGPYTLVTNAGYVASWSAAFTTESIFSLANTANDHGDREGVGYVANPDGYGAFVATPTFVALLEEDPADVRLGLLKPNGAHPKGYVAKLPGKTNIFDSNIPMIRLSEVYLIAAEAAMRNGNPASAKTYVDAIRKRANPAAADEPVNIDLVMKERRKELIGEGHRFFDIMRLGVSVDRQCATSFMHADECPTVGWDQVYCVLPIPRHEINLNPDILPTPGYSNN